VSTHTRLGRRRHRNSPELTDMSCAEACYIIWYRGLYARYFLSECCQPLVFASTLAEGRDTLPPLVCVCPTVAASITR
jgi:hypothetical protein